MMWDHVMERVKTVVLGDPTLSGIFGTGYRKAGPSDQLVPVIEWNLLSDMDTELWSPMLVQFDLWTTRAEDARIAERRMRTLFHKPTSITFGFYTMFSEYSGGSDLATPNRANYTGRGIRFTFTPLRELYAQA